MAYETEIENIDKWLNYAKEVHIESNDGEADYYALSASWIISSIERSFFKINVSLCSATDDIENDMKEMFQLLCNNQ